MVKYVVLILLFSGLLVSQSMPASKPGSATLLSIPSLEVTFESDQKLSTLFGEGGYPAVFSDGCDASGNPYVRVRRSVPPNDTEVLKFDPNGIVTFETSKISDIVEPKWVADFISDSKLYILLQGDTRTEQRTTKSDDGKNVVDWVTKGEPRYYIAQFGPDGSYKGALKLDLPFRPMHLSGFRSGSFLTTGSDENKMTKVHRRILPPCCSPVSVRSFPIRIVSCMSGVDLARQSIESAQGEKRVL